MAYNRAERPCHKNWYLGYYTRNPGEFYKYEGEFRTPHEAAASVGLNAYGYDPESKTFVPWQEGVHNPLRADCAKTPAGAENPYIVAFKRPILELKFAIRKLEPAKRLKKVVQTGDEVTVMANEAVEWKVSGAEVKILQTHPAMLIFKVLAKSGTVKISAKGRCDTKTISFGITSKPIVLKSETIATLPANRSRTTIGVGEAVKVRVTSEEPVTWRISGASAKITERKNKEMTFTVSDVVGTVTVTAKSPSDEQSLDFQVIAPSGIHYYEDLKHIKFHTVYFHLKDTFSFMVVNLHMRLLPSTVNFDNVQIREVNIRAETRGEIFQSASEEGLWHIRTAFKKDGTPTRPYGDTADIVSTHSSINYVAHPDLIGIADADSASKYLPLIEENYAIFKIPVQWNLKSKSRYHTFATIIQEIRIDTSGTIKNKKGNYTSRPIKYSNPSENEELRTHFISG